MWCHVGAVSKQNNPKDMHERAGAHDVHDTVLSPVGCEAPLNFNTPRALKHHSHKLSASLLMLQQHSVPHVGRVEKVSVSEGTSMLKLTAPQVVYLQRAHHFKVQGLDRVPLMTN